MTLYTVTSHYPTGDAETVTAHRASTAADRAYAAVYAQFEAQALLDRPAAWTAIRQLPTDYRAIPVDPVTGRREVTIPCGYERSVTIVAGSRVRGLQAAALAARVRGLVAWNHTAAELAAIVRARRNGAGVRLTFRDGSAAFIPAGTADVRVVA